MLVPSTRKSSCGQAVVLRPGSAWAACGSSRTLMCLTENLELDAGEEEVACWGGQGSAVSGGCGVQV